MNLAWEQLLYKGGRKRKLPRGELATKHVIHHAWSDAFAWSSATIDANTWVPQE